MKTQTPASVESPDLAFPHINGINMGVAVELLGQEIAKRATDIDDEKKGRASPVRIWALQDEMRALRRRQQGLRSEDVAGVQAVFAEFGDQRL